MGNLDKGFTGKMCITPDGARRARMGIGYLPQESSIFRGLNVEDNIRSILQVVEVEFSKIPKSQH